MNTFSRLFNSLADALANALGYRREAETTYEFVKGHAYRRVDFVQWVKR